MHSGLSSALAIGAATLVVASLHLGTFAFDRSPSHFDEWRNVGLARRAITTGTLGAEEPAGSPNGLARDIADRNRSPLFIAGVATWILATGDPVAEYKVLALFFVILALLGIFTLTRSLGARPLSALVAALAVGALPSSKMLLGLPLAVPSSASLGLLTLALAAHVRLSGGGAAAGRRWKWLLAASVAALAGVYLLSLLVFGALVAVDWLARRELRESPYGRILLWLGLGGVAVLVFAEWQGTARATLQHFVDHLVLEKRWHLQKVRTFPLGYLVPWSLLGLALFGAASCLRHRERLWVAVLLLASLLSLAGYELLSYGLVVPYQRLWLYLGLGACVCGGLGTERLVEALERRSAPSWAAPVLAAVLAGLIVAWPRPIIPRSDAEMRPRPAFKKAARWIESNHAPPDRVYAPRNFALFVEPLTGLQAAPGIMDAGLTGQRPPAFDCDAGWEVAIGPIDCPGYRLAFQARRMSVFVQAGDIETPAQAGEDRGEAPDSLPRGRSRTLR